MYGVNNMGSIVSSVLEPFTGAKATRAAAEQAAATQSQAAKDAAAAAQFRPIGLTTAFGSSQFTREIDPTTGMPYVSSASYQAAPELAALQQSLMSQYGAGLLSAQQQQQQFEALSPAAQSLFSLGQGYLSESPEAARQRYISQQQALLAPQQEQALSNVRNRLFQSGRTGLATGGTSTGMAQTNPEMAAYYNALAQQQAQIAAGADQAAQQQAQFGAGLFGQGAGLLGTQAQLGSAAYTPLQTMLGLSGQVESMAQMPYNLSLGLGTAAQQGQLAGSNMYSQGISNAANTQYQGTMAANAANAQFLSGLIGGAANIYGRSRQGTGSMWG